MQTKPTCTFYVQTIPPVHISSETILATPEIRRNKNELKRLKLKIQTLSNKGVNISIYGDLLSQKARTFLLRELEGLLSKYEKTAIVTTTSVVPLINKLIPVPIHQFDSMAGFQMPHLGEGFSKIEHISTKQSPNVLTFLLEEMSNFEQKNSHHTETVLAHGKTSRDYLKNMGVEDKAFLCAAIMHDCGKINTQTFGDDGEAHYYGHENAGAYIFLSLATEIKKTFQLSDEEFQRALYLINYHMRPNKWKNSSHAKRRDERVFGPEFIHDLEIFHKAYKFRPYQHVQQL